ncbi:DUF4839 domain-containing protein [Streptococcus suis]|uniref:DUF4839 domain-containing protein n=1 Tax=Streptococcus suis TaxID=1307 RepID=UPI000CF5A7E7|nr:DUF4839 domain-containing protein [Streptococcus suis]
MLKKFLFLCLAFFASFSLVACGSSSEPTNTNKIAIPVGSSPEESDYQSVQKQLEDAGFENVSTQKIEDLTFGIFTKDGEIEKITVKGEEVFSKGDLFEKDVPITIHYHTFKEYDNETEESSSEPVETSESSSNASTTLSSSVEEVTEPVKEEVITVDNPDFAYVTSNYDESKAKEFVEKYKGQIVEFDGHVAYTAPYGNYDTRFDFLLETGDWIDENTSNYTGIPMKFENVNFYDLNFTDDTDSVPLGTNLHIKARIVGAAKLGQLIYLEPVELRSR